MINIPQKFMARQLPIFEKLFEHVYSERKNKLFSVIKKNNRVLEIGAGTGVNLKYYPKGLSLTVIEPNVLLHKYLLENARLNNIKLKIIGARSEKIPFKDSSFDYVISTLVLCSVNNMAVSLGEIKRVLRKGGKYVFIEHVVDKNNIFRRVIQTIFAHSPWTYFGDGCRPNRDISFELKKAGFREINIKEYYQDGLGLIGYGIKSHIEGIALK